MFRNYQTCFLNRSGQGFLFCYRSTGSEPCIQSAIHYTNILHTGIHQKRCGTHRSDLSGFLSRMVLGHIGITCTSIENNSGIARYTVCLQFFFKFFRSAAVPIILIFKDECIKPDRARDMPFIIISPVIKVNVSQNESIDIVWLRVFTF